MPEEDFQEFYEIIRKKESDPNTPFIRTKYIPGEGSTAYGPLQTTGPRVDTMLNVLRGSLTEEELSALNLLRDRQKMAAQYGGSDRAKYEDSDNSNYKSKEFLDMYDYGGNLGIDDPLVLSAIESAQRKELRRHYVNHGRNFSDAAAAWHGGDNWKSSPDSAKKRRTAAYGEDALARLAKRKKKMSAGGIVDIHGRRLI